VTHLPRPIPGPPPLYANVEGPPEPLDSYPAAYRAKSIVDLLVSFAPGGRSGPDQLTDDELERMLGVDHSETPSGGARGGGSR
jgi:hypothetical protein